MFSKEHSPIPGIAEKAANPTICFHGVSSESETTEDAKGSVRAQARKRTFFCVSSSAVSEAKYARYAVIGQCAAVTDASPNRQTSSQTASMSSDQARRMIVAITIHYRAAGQAALRQTTLPPQRNPNGEDSSHPRCRDRANQRLARRQRQAVPRLEQLQAESRVRGSPSRPEHSSPPPPTRQPGRVRSGCWPAVRRMSGSTPPRRSSLRSDRCRGTTRPDQHRAQYESTCPR